MSFLRQPYKVMPILLALNAAVGIWFWKVPALDFGLHIVAMVVAAVAVDTAINFAKHKKFIFSKSGLISGLILGSIVSPGALLPSLAAAVLAIASKHFVVWKGRHIFNPAGFGSYVTSFFGTGVGWWAGNPFGVLFLYPDYLVKRLYLAGTFVPIWYALQVLMTGSLSVLTLNWTLFFMGFVMAIEPVTTPSSKKAQVIFGAALAVLTSLLGIFAGAIGGEVLLLGLLIMNVLARPIEAWAKKAKAAPSPVPAE